MFVLGIESSCDETAVALVSDSGGSLQILANSIASQNAVHGPYGGVVPELASRQHMAVILPLIEQALKQSDLTLDQVDGIAVTNRPGLLGSLLVGVQVAKALAVSKKIPFIGVSHLEGHLMAPRLEHAELRYPFVALLVSGGHTLLYHVKDFADYVLLGGTKDDAAGEAFDKVAKLLGLAYPGGPEIGRMALAGNPKAIRFPTGKIQGKPYDFSFSGLKTAVLQYVNKNCRGSLRDQQIADICASFQETVVDDLISKAQGAAEALGIKAIVVSGGVACNKRLREKMPQAFFPSPLLCTDNGAMIAAVGLEYFKRGLRSEESLNAFANEDLNLQHVLPLPLGRGLGRGGELS